jgi:uncharacterized protein
VNWNNWNPFLRYPVVSLLATAAISIPLILQMGGFQVTSETRALLEGDQRNLSSYEKVKEILADVEVLALSMECEEVFSPAGIDAVRRVSEAFTHQEGVRDVKSLTHSSKPVRRGFTFAMVPLIPPGSVTPEGLAELKTFCLGHPLIRDVMVAGDSRHTVITVTYDRDLENPEQQRSLNSEIESILGPFLQEGLRFERVAVPLIEHEIRSTLRRDISRFLPAAALILTSILWVAFRSWRILLLVLANQAVVVALLPGLIQISGYSLSVFTLLIFPLLTGIHLTLLIHLFTSLQRMASPGTPPMTLIERALTEVFKPCLFAALTTGIGMLSLALSDVRQVREFGVLGTLGIVLIFTVTFGPGLAVLQILLTRGNLLGFPSPPPRPNSSPPDLPPTGTRFPRVLTRFATERRGLVLALAGILVVASCIGIGRIRTDIRAVEFLSPESPTRKAVEEFDRVYGGINVVQIELDTGAPNGVNSLPFLRYVQSVQEYASAKREVSGVYSYAQLLAMINQIWEGGKPGALKLPDNVWLINLFVVALKTQDFPFLTALADPELRTAHLVVRTPDMPSRQYLELVNDVLKFAQDNKPSNVSVSAAEGVHSILEADQRILRSQRESVFTTLLVVGAVLSVLWRSPLLACLTLVTNALPVALVIALAGFLDVPLNSITLMVAAITLGIAVDDSIHFITHWRGCRAAGSSNEEALLESFRIKARPIISTSAILILLLTVFWLSSFPPVVHFGILSATAFVGALVGTLFLLPSLLAWRRNT